MNAQNAVDKTIDVIGFTICGVGGFKTVRVVGGKVTERMVSAIIDMHRKLKDENNKLSYHDDREEPTSISEEHIRVKHALRLITTVKNNLTRYRGLKPQLVQRDLSSEVISLTTTQFLTESDWIYEKNIHTFLSKLSELEAAINGPFERVAVKSNSHPNDVAPLLCVCSGGIFKDRPFYLYMSWNDIGDFGQGSPDKAAQYLVSRAINTVKNFKLSDYLRTTGRPKEMIKQDLLFLDEQFDHLGEIKVQVIPDSVFSVGAVGRHRIGESPYEKIAGTGNTLLLESESRLSDYIVNTFIDDIHSIS